MLPANIESNAQKLYFNNPKTFLARGEKFEEIGFGGITLRTFIGRIVFIIRDLITWGGETKKVNDLVIATLTAMRSQLNDDNKTIFEKRWHFNGDERFGKYPGAPVKGATYKQFAEHILKSGYAKVERIKRDADEMLQDLHTLNRKNFSSAQEMEGVVNYTLNIANEVGKPSLTLEDWKLFIKECERNSKVNNH